MLKAIKERLERGLEKIDKLENFLERTFAFESLKIDLGLKPQVFEKLVNTLIRSQEDNEPTDFDSIMASDDGLKPIDAEYALKTIKQVERIQATLQLDLGTRFLLARR